MGQRMVQLDSTYTGNSDGSGVLHVSQLPPNPAILAPGPAFIFTVVNGVPSIGMQVMIGSGQLGTQQTLDVQSLPNSSMSQTVNSSQSHNSGKSLFREARLSTSMAFGALVLLLGLQGLY